MNHGPPAEPGVGPAATEGRERDGAGPAHLLELDSVAMVYPARNGIPEVRVFEDLSECVDQGQLVACAGRSGSGKTTLLRIAAGLLRPTAGRVLWDGSDIAALSADRQAVQRGAHLGFVFQGAALIESLTAAENVLLPSVARGVHRDGRARAVRLLDEVGVGSRANHLPSQLSGGEQQRIGIARALFRDPPLLLVDEPTANLDRATADGVVRLLVDLARHGRGLLVASHDPAMLALADRTLRIEDG
jgi:lipoprotein-releasing system ATP-binding protein